MIKNVLIVAFFSLLSFSHSSWAREEKRGDLVSVKKGLRGYTLSLSVRNVMLGEIIEELATKCAIRVVIYEKAILSLPVSVSFTDVSLKKSIKRIIKAAGIKNHLITYRDDSRGNPEIAELTFLGSTQEKPITFSRELVHTKRGGEKKVRSFTKREDSSEDTFSEKIESFKERYHWEDTETREMAGYLLEMMPDEARESGLKELARGLDRMVTEGQEVDEEILYRAIEATVPPRVAPVMMRSLKKSVEKYKRGEDSEVSGQSANDLYREFIEKTKRNPDRGKID